MTSFATRIRRCRAQAALEAHASSIGDNGDREEGLIDLLTDLRHWCDGQRIVFDDCLDLSRVHHLAETRGVP